MSSLCLRVSTTGELRERERVRVTVRVRVGVRVRVWTRVWVRVGVRVRVTVRVRVGVRVRVQGPDKYHWTVSRTRVWVAAHLRWRS